MPNGNFDYEEKLLACSRGDYGALRSLYEHEAAWLMGVAMRIVRRREIADEVLHDAFIQIWQRSSTYQPALGSARGWIYSIVRNRALHILRLNHHELPVADTVTEERPSDDPGPADVLSEHRSAQALHHCLEGLDDQKRLCILLAYSEGYTQAQIALHLDRPLGTIKAWTRRALHLLKECLS